MYLIEALQSERKCSFTGHLRWSCLNSGELQIAANKGPKSVPSPVTLTASFSDFHSYKNVTDLVRPATHDCLLHEKERGSNMNAAPAL